MSAGWTDVPTLGEVLAKLEAQTTSAPVTGVASLMDREAANTHLLDSLWLRQSLYGIDGKGGLVERVKLRAQAIAPPGYVWTDCLLEALGQELQANSNAVQSLEDGAVRGA